MTDSIHQSSRGAEEALDDAHEDDLGRQSIETVIASLGSRSNAEREALLKALLDGDGDGTGAGAVSGLELIGVENKGKSGSGVGPAASNTSGHPVSGTSPHKIVEKQSSNQRSRSDCDTRLSHTRATEKHLNTSDRSTNVSGNCMIC